MNRSTVHLLDLPNEILFNILKKLDNVDVLYSLFGINNDRLDSIAREETFSNILNFVSTVHNIIINDSIVDRFCNKILPQICYNVKCLIVEPMFMERILLATHYSNLTELKLFNFQRVSSLQYFTDDSPFRHIFKQQITKLDLINEDWECAIESLIDYTKKVYAHILTCFENLEHLNVIQTSIRAYPGLAVRYLPSSVFSSSTLTYLCINVGTLTDCLCLLDGRLKQLTTFIVRVYCMDIDSSINHTMVEYDNNIVRLLRRMLYLEKLTLYLCIACQGAFIDPIYLLHEFTMYMSRLYSFNFYLSTENNTNDLIHYLSNNDVKRNHTNIGHQEVLDMVCFSVNTATYHIFTLPFEFAKLMSVGNIFPNIIFNYVIELWVHDVVPFEYEFFVRISKAFPLLKHFYVSIFASLSFNTEVSSPNIESCEVVKYPHLTLLDIRRTNINYVEQFLNETITHLPCLSELRVVYEELRIITNDFTRKATQRNCVNVRRLITGRDIVASNRALCLHAASVDNLIFICYPLNIYIVVDGYCYFVTSSHALYPCKLRYFVLQIAHLGSLCYTCLATLDQYLLSSRNVRIHQMNFDACQTKQCIVIVFILIALHSIAMAVYFGDINHHCAFVSDVYALYYLFAVIILLYSVIPTLFLLIFGSLTLIQLQAVTSRSARQDQQLSRMHLIQSVSVVQGTAKWSRSRDRD
ncbi:unnamed protein product [Rotaria sp. Silwood2]|nr:unnamed protein product [Rotaria sp. Silwood2]CAF3084720.1 unnamed protein product [Rotaria sp. Silwood2]CAF3404752.1 unnamed protein product [Rotaria sp. Silwood2]